MARPSPYVDLEEVVLPLRRAASHHPTGILLAIARIRRDRSRPRRYLFTLRSTTSSSATNLNAPHGEPLPAGHLPVRSLSPYQDWQKLALDQAH